MSISTESLDSAPPRSSSSFDAYHKERMAVEDRRATMASHVQYYSGTFQQYLQDFVPCSLPYAAMNDVSNVFSSLNLEKGGNEWKYSELIDGLESLVSPFGDTRVYFHDSHGTRMACPFRKFSRAESWTSPDVCVSFPGTPMSPHLLESSPWQHVAMVIHAQPSSDDDPYPGDYVVVAKSAISNIRNARNLLLAHGFLAAFVINIYACVVRVVRYDHSSAIVSPAFAIHEHPEYLQRFLWHFTHPTSPDITVVGADPTVRRLVADDWLWVKEQLERANVRDIDSDLAGFQEGRRALVPSSADDTTMRPYILYRLLDINTRLFSKATSVWLAIEDTRIQDSDGRLINDPTRTTVLKPRVLKEAWQEVRRKPEIAFYDRLATTIPDEERYGLPRLACGGDLGQLDVLHRGSSTSDVSVTGTRPPSAVFTDTDPATEERLTSLNEIRNPQHQTSSWTTCAGKDLTHWGRSCMRMVFENVGRPLTQAKNTKEMVRAIRDAIIGHRLAFEKAGILHRDISVGNILIVDEAKDDRFTGFIHDFDHSIMTDIAPEHEMHAPVYVETSDMQTVLLFDVNECTQRVGTYPFLAVEILDGPVAVHSVHHDLESFYWVLVWLVLRHTAHSFTQAQARDVFLCGDLDSIRCGMKCLWLDRQVYKFDIPGNPPLVKLLRDLSLLVIMSIGNQLMKLKPEWITYDAVIQSFDEALAAPGWPEDDIIPCNWRAEEPLPSVIQWTLGEPIPSPSEKRRGPTRPHIVNEPSVPKAASTDELASAHKRQCSGISLAPPTSPRQCAPSLPPSTRKRKAEKNQHAAEDAGDSRILKKTKH